MFTKKGIRAESCTFCQYRKTVNVACFLYPDPSFILSTDYQFKQFCERTQVEFGDLTKEVISEYVKTGEPL